MVYVVAHIALYDLVNIICLDHRSVLILVLSRWTLIMHGKNAILGFMYLVILSD